MLQMPGASQRVHRCAHEMLSSIVCFDSALAGDFQNILEALGAARAMHQFPVALHTRAKNRAHFCDIRTLLVPVHAA